ncbi:hypothetical protein [Zavarzinia sp.]|uniref:hypothetical protein n=1 Tax=Zavarzinia sp. TaxID=2027920 RepID=UPI00356A3858
MFALLFKAFAILLALGLAYVSIKRAVLGSQPKRTEAPSPPSPKPTETIEADDLVRCPSCGTYRPAGQSCSTPGCPARPT